MLNVAIVGGAKVADLVDPKYIDVSKYNIVKAHQFVSDAFDDILNNYAEYLDVNVILVLQYGIKDDETKEEQIRDLQEVISVSRIESKVYFVLNDLALYNTIEALEEPVVCRNARIIHLPKIYNKNIMDIIEGKMDDVGITMEEINVIDEYTEDDIDFNLEPDEKVFIYEPDIDTGGGNVKIVGDEKEITSLGDLRKKNKKGKIFAPAPTVDIGGDTSNTNDYTADDLEGKKKKKTKDKPEPAPKSKLFGGNGSSFTGVIGVTGDRNSGVSTTAANIAETFSQLGRTVLLIDLDFFRRFQSIIYNDFGEYENNQPKTQLGVYYALNNTAVIDDLAVIVRDNLALLGNSRKPEYFSSPFVDRTLDDIAVSTRVHTLIGVAKGIFDVIVLDFPIDQMKKIMESTIIVDRFVICVENNIHQLDTLFNLVLADLLEEHELYVNSLIAKSSVVLTKYSSHSKYGRQEMNESLVQDMVQSAVYGKMTVIGRVSYSNVFANIGNNKKSIIDLHDTTRNEFRNIVNNIKI